MIRVEAHGVYTQPKSKRIEPPVKIDWKDYPNFKETEFKCTASGLCKMEPKFLEAMQYLRQNFGRPLTISSGYRDPTTHPIEIKKIEKGVHTYGIAADILISHGLAHELLSTIMMLKIFTGVGISQKDIPDIDLFT
jgi:zinc D-Ala-D-Ala carboxypeptidase